MVPQMGTGTVFSVSWSDDMGALAVVVMSRRRAFAVDAAGPPLLEQDLCHHSLVLVVQQMTMKD